MPPLNSETAAGRLYSVFRSLQNPWQDPRFPFSFDLQAIEGRARTLAAEASVPYVSNNLSRIQGFSDLAARGGRSSSVSLGVELVRRPMTLCQGSAVSDSLRVGTLFGYSEFPVARMVTGPATQVAAESTLARHAMRRLIHGVEALRFGIPGLASWHELLPTIQGICRTFHGPLPPGLRNLALGLAVVLLVGAAESSA